MGYIPLKTGRLRTVAGDARYLIVVSIVRVDIPDATILHQCDMVSVYEVHVRPDIKRKCLFQNGAVQHGEIRHRQDTGEEIGDLLARFLACSFKHPYDLSQSERRGETMLPALDDVLEKLPAAQGLPLIVLQIETKEYAGIYKDHPISPWTCRPISEAVRSLSLSKSSGAPRCSPAP